MIAPGPTGAKGRVSIRTQSVREAVRWASEALGLERPALAR